MKKKNKKKILITGSKGFIGYHLKENLKNNYELFVPDKIKLNLKNKSKLKNYIDKLQPDFIINLVSSTKFKKDFKKEKYNQSINTFLTNKNLVDAINKNCKLVIFFGSIEEYGKCKLPYSEKMQPKPRSLYGKYKYKSYLYTKKKLKKKKINYIWLRPSLTFGYKDNKERYLGSIINSLKNKQKIDLYPGNQSRDYIYVGDLCRIIKLLLLFKNFKTNKVLNVSAENYVKLNKIPRLVEKITNKKLPYVFKENKNEINILNSNKELKRLFPKFKFSNFYQSLKKVIRKELKAL